MRAFRQNPNVIRSVPNSAVVVPSAMPVAIMAPIKPV
jgi:hypothetical protein